MRAQVFVFGIEVLDGGKKRFKGSDGQTRHFKKWETLKVRLRIILFKLRLPKKDICKKKGRGAGGSVADALNDMMGGSEKGAVKVNIIEILL